MINAFDANLRDLLDVRDGYSAFCREERNFVALLYHLLLIPGNAKIFLENLGFGGYSEKDVRIYFEYAHLRDLWRRAGEDVIDARNARYRMAIISMLSLQDKDLPSLDGGCEEFNKVFTTKASVRHVQMPSRWNDSMFQSWVDRRDRDFAERACMLKWAFNAKPDLVFHLGNEKAICVEAKVESRVDMYVANAKSASKGSVFKKSQTEVQKLIFDLLGYKDTCFLMLNKNEGNPCQWRKVFGWFSDDGSSTTREFLRSKIIG